MDEIKQVKDLIPQSIQERIRLAEINLLNTTEFKKTLKYIQNIGYDVDEKFVSRNYRDMSLVYEQSIVCQSCPGLNNCPLCYPGFITVLGDITRDRNTNQIIHIYSGLKECEARIKYNNQIKIESMLKSSRLPDMFKKKTFDSFKVTEGTKKGYDLAMSFCKNQNQRGIVFAGTPGTGKTHLAGSIMNEYIKRYQECIFCTVPELLSDIRKTIKSDKETSELMELIKNTPLLILDDLGAEKTTDWVAEQLFVIFNARLMWEKRTIVTTNFEKASDLIEKLGGDYTGQRIVSRIREMCEWVVMTGSDYRLNMR